VFLTNLRANPNDDRRIEASGIREELTEMSVVGRFQLILDNDLPVPTRVTGFNVGGKRSDCGFGLREFQIQPQRLPEETEVCAKPWSEIGWLGFPKRTRLYVFQLTEIA